MSSKLDVDGNIKRLQELGYDITGYDHEVYSRLYLLRILAEKVARLEEILEGHDEHER